MTLETATRYEDGDKAIAAAREALEHAFSYLPGNDPEQVWRRKERTLTAALTSADDAYTDAVQAAVNGSPHCGDWSMVQQAGIVVRQARAALTHHRATR